MHLKDGMPRGRGTGVLLSVILALCAAGHVARAQQGGDAQQKASASAANSGDLEGLLDLPIEQLAKMPVAVPSMDIPVTSVTKEASTVGRSAAAVRMRTDRSRRFLAASMEWSLGNTRDNSRQL